MIPIIGAKPVVGNTTNPTWFVAYDQNVTLSEGETVFSSIAIGPAASERRIIVLIGADSTNITGFKWGTTSFTPNIQNGWGREAIQGDLLVTTGTSGNLTIVRPVSEGDTFIGTVDVSLVVIVANNVGTFVQWNRSASAASSGYISTSLSTGPAGSKGLVFGTLTSEFQLNTTWDLPSGIVKQLDRNISSRRHSWAVAETNGGTVTVRAYQNNTWNDKALVAAAFRKT